MSIRLRLALAIDALLLIALFTFGVIIYDSQKALLLRKAKEARESSLKSLASVTAETLAGEDDGPLIAYTSGLKRMVKELEVAYVSDGKFILAHTDRKLAPRQLPLSGGGESMRAFSNRLLVRKAVTPDTAKGVSFSRKRVVAKGQAYDVVVGYSEARVAEGVQKALDAVLVILAGTLLALWLSARLTRPIRALAEALAATGSGDMTRQLSDTARRDEIGVLNREFNRMVAGLRELDEMKKDFVSSVTHELKSPLGAIESYLDLMSYEIAQGKNDPQVCSTKIPKFLENINFVKQNSGRLLKFITDLLDASKIERGKFEIARRPAQIEPLISAAVQLFQERARASGIALRAQLQPRLPQPALDPERITQVLQNLISNALKFTPAGGSVTVSAGLVRPERPAAAGGDGRKADLAQTRALRVTVEDTGAGISKEALEKLFGKFYQVPGSRTSAIGPKGTGLGLYIVKNIVEAHDGRVFAESSAGGSCFGFELPA
jgi:signal transduction histidine kinase